MYGLNLMVQAAMVTELCTNFFLYNACHASEFFILYTRANFEKSGHI